MKVYIMNIFALSFAIVGIIMLGSTNITAQSVVSAQQEPIITQKFLIKTSKGDILVGIYGKDAPKTAENFTKLAATKYYDSILFHRVVPDFVIQAGDPNTRDITKRDRWGRGGQSAFGGKFEDELNPDAPSYRTGYLRGTLAMANSGPNSNSSQFFICLDDQDSLPKKYTIFGKVLEGIDAVDDIGGVELNGSVPVEPVMIYSVREVLD